MIEEIQHLRTEIEDELRSVASSDALENFRLKHLVRKGSIARLFSAMRSLPSERRPSIGRSLNELRTFAESAYQSKKSDLEVSPKGAEEYLDLSLPGRRNPIGTKHPITQTYEEIRQIFFGMGFRVAEGPEIEDDYHNFEALNFPPDHPARDMQDTFFIKPDVVLRTHTSPVQIRIMEQEKPPVRFIMPGKVYRNEAISARSYCLFHQVEGLYVDVGVTFSELKGTLVSFARQFFGNSIKYRFRPSYFPFTEPSAEMDISCFICGGRGCRVCKGGGWLEILGAGMVDPNVFRFVDYNAEKYSGYAFGMGIERIAMLRYGIDDIRIFFENDVRFLNQF